MNSYRQNSARKRLLAASALVIVLLTIDLLSGGKVRAFSREAGSGLWRLGISAEESVRESGFFTSRRALEDANASLSEQNAQLEGRAAAYQVLKDENESLRAMLRVAGNKRGITAPVVSSFRASPYGTFLVGAGSLDDVAVGELVLTSENFVVGRVTDIDQNSSLVRELFAAGVSTDALVRGVGTSVQGQGGGNARADLPREASVSVGDSVISPVLGGRAIGVVGAVEDKPASAYRRIYIRLPANLSAMRFVYLVKQEKL